MSPLLLPFFAVLASVSGHGGVLWPPTWQAGVATPIEQINSSAVSSDPPARDPRTGYWITQARSWLSDQSYTGGYGDEFRGTGPVTNTYLHPNPFARCKARCQQYRNPWAAPGRAPSLGGGCGVSGGNPFGCPKDQDTRPPGSQCGQTKNRGTWSYGTDQRLMDYPKMLTTEWELGSVQDVVHTSNGGHAGGYTYRLCRLPEGGRPAITEECFAENVLEYATNVTMIKAINHETNGEFQWGDGDFTGEGEWEPLDQEDLRVGTHPEGSAWRPVGKYVKSSTTLRKDAVRVPGHLQPGDYVLGWRWDGEDISQVWVSCSSVRLVKGEGWMDDRPRK